MTEFWDGNSGNSGNSGDSIPTSQLYLAATSKTPKLTAQPQASKISHEATKARRCRAWGCGGSSARAEGLQDHGSAQSACGGRSLFVASCEPIPFQHLRSQPRNLLKPLPRPSKNNFPTDPALAYPAAVRCGWPAQRMGLLAACATWRMGAGDDRRGRPGKAAERSPRHDHHAESLLRRVMQEPGPRPVA